MFRGPISQVCLNPITFFCFFLPPLSPLPRTLLTSRPPAALLLDWEQPTASREDAFGILSTLPTLNARPLCCLCREIQIDSPLEQPGRFSSSQQLFIFGACFMLLCIVRRTDCKLRGIFPLSRAYYFRRKMVIVSQSQ